MGIAARHPADLPAAHLCDPDLRAKHDDEHLLLGHFHPGLHPQRALDLLRDRHRRPHLGLLQGRERGQHQHLAARLRSPGARQIGAVGAAIGADDGRAAVDDQLQPGREKQPVAGPGHHLLG